ncbi:MAG TPA: hypothetical protein VMV31_12155 [Terriglobales bacterium]|nr:hypothetical protein [Terriglobales bacterium]
MTLRSTAILVLALAATLASPRPRALAQAASTSKSYAGVIGDTMCGLKHDMGGSDSECTRKCVAAGAGYALIIGKKFYGLATQDKKTLAALDKLAGKRAVVTGTMVGTAIVVKTVAAR